MESATRHQPWPPVAPARAAGRLAARARVSASDRAARIALGTLVAGVATLVVVAAGQPSTLVPPGKGGFELWLAGPFKGLAAGLPEAPLFASITFSSLMALMLGAYFVVLVSVRNLSARAVVAAIGVVHALLLLGPPLSLTDVFNYVDYARLGALHGVNPYVQPPAAVPGDPSYDFATWHHLLSPYGPLFTLGSYALVPLGVPGAFWALKLLTVAASLGCLRLVWTLAERRGRDPRTAVAWVGLNPLVLVYGVGGVHNDFFVLGAILLGVGAVLTDRPARGGVALTGAAALKLSGGVVAPFAFLGTARERRPRLLAGALAAAAVAIALSLAAFGFHGPGLDTQSDLVTPLSPANLLGLVLGQGGATAAVRVLVKVGLAIALALLLRQAWRGADWVTTAGWATLALVVSLTWEMPWYVLWVLPFAVLGASRGLRRSVVALTVFLAVTLAPITGYLLTNACHCHPGNTDTGKDNAHAIRKHLR